MEKKTIRQILYTKESKSDFIVKDKEVTKIKVSEQSEDERCNRILLWIKSHNKFKWSTMCLEIGLDKGNFQKMLKKDKISVALNYIIKIETELKKYGF
jgi:hypothetical protein